MEDAKSGKFEGEAGRHVSNTTITTPGYPTLAATFSPALNAPTWSFDIASADNKLLGDDRGMESSASMPSLSFGSTSSGNADTPSVSQFDDETMMAGSTPTPYMASSPPPALSAFHMPSSPTSSEPALFSSDDQPDALTVDNYSTPRQKRKYPGSWYYSPQHNIAPVGGPKRAKFTRNLDSGVYFNSDDSQEDDQVRESIEQNVLGLGMQMEEEAAAAADREQELVKDEVTDREPTEDVDMGQELAAIPDEGVMIVQSTPGRMDIDVKPGHPAMIALQRDICTETSHMDDYERNLYTTIREGAFKNSTVYHLSSTLAQDKHLKHLDMLNTVIKEPLDPGADAPGEEYFQSLQPEIQIYLSNNFLEHLSSSLFKVEFLTVLSLRGNDITELPPQIGDLRNLKQLDVCNNKIQSFPYELLSLLPGFGDLDLFSFAGNPLLEGINTQAVQSTIGGAHRNDSNLVEVGHSLQAARDRTNARLYNEAETYFSAACALKWREENQHPTDNSTSFVRRALSPSQADPVRMVGSTAVTYYGHNGLLLDGSPVALSSDLPVIVKCRLGTFGAPRKAFTPSQMSCVRSLFSAATDQALIHLSTDEIRQLVGEPLPNDLDRCLEVADQNAASVFDNFRVCHTCQRRFSVVRAEWIEYWALPSSGIYPDFVPFRRRVCSFGCVR